MHSFTADDLIVTGGSVFEVIPVQHTNDYFVWLAVNPGAGAFSVVIKSGARRPGLANPRGILGNNLILLGFGNFLGGAPGKFELPKAIYGISRE